jgi:BirA family biotin operon repressor/biotin-[acetyl-CoA-carboxylase] ligase
LQNNTFSGLFIGHNLVTLTEVDSTNNFLKQSLANSTPLTEGTVIMAESQYAGRGQQSNRWHSEPGKNLTFSILLNPVFLLPAEQFKLNVVISVGIVKALKKIIGDGVKIKWPNDIYFNDIKLAGILIENMIQGGRLKNSIIGIGLNVNQSKFPVEAGNAGSLKQILHSDYDLKTLLAEICTHIEAAYLKLRAGNISELKSFYVDNLYWFNELRSFNAGGININGTIVKVTESGQLVVSVNNQERLYNFKEIAFLNK